MLYRPKFCSECGERIQRAEWRLTTSRQYCDLCATEHPFMNRVPLFGLALCVLVLIAGAKTAFFPGAQESALPQPRPLVSQPVQKNHSSALKPQPSEPSRELPADIPINASKTGGERVNGKEKSVEPVYFCGAPTKKGTPCSRRVKTKGYCWQHNKTAEE